MSEDESRRRYIKGELDKVTPSGGQVKLKLLNAEGETFWLNVTSDQQAAIEKILLPDPADNVSYAPCIQGVVDDGNHKSEFMLPLDRYDVPFTQWGADTMILGERVDLLEGMAGAAREWASENLPQDDEEDGDE